MSICFINDGGVCLDENFLVAPEHTCAFVKLSPGKNDWCFNGCLLLQASEDLLMNHYIDLKDRPFFPQLVKYMSSGPVVAMVRDSPTHLKQICWAEKVLVALNAPVLVNKSKIHTWASLVQISQ